MSSYLEMEEENQRKEQMLAELKKLAAAAFRSRDEAEKKNQLEKQKNEKLRSIVKTLMLHKASVHNHAGTYWTKI